METKQAYQEKYEAQLREWSAKVDQLRARSDRAKAEAKINLWLVASVLRGPRGSG
jgi:hypothetical protein